MIDPVNATLSEFWDGKWTKTPASKSLQSTGFAAWMSPPIRPGKRNCKEETNAFQPILGWCLKHSPSLGIANPEVLYCSFRFGKPSQFNRSWNCHQQCLIIESSTINSISAWCWQATSSVPSHTERNWTNPPHAPGLLIAAVAIEIIPICIYGFWSSKSLQTRFSRQKISSDLQLSITATISIKMSFFA